MSGIAAKGALPAAARSPVLASVFTVLLLSLALGGCASTQHSVDPEATLTEPGLPEPTTQRPTLGLRLRVTPASEVPAAASSGRTHVLKVVKVRAEQVGESAGLRSGDILLSLDSVPVSGMRDAFAVMQNKRWGDPIDITLYRDNEVQHVHAQMNPP